MVRVEREDERLLTMEATTTSETSTRLHGATTQETAIFTIAAVKSPYLKRSNSYTRF
jgi:hypothetical protein